MYVISVIHYRTRKHIILMPIVYWQLHFVKRNVLVILSIAREVLTKRPENIREFAAGEFSYVHIRMW